MLFSNIHLTDGMIQTKERKYRISRLVEEFREMLNLPHEDIIVELEDEVNWYNYIITTYSLMKEPTSRIPYPFIVGYIHHKFE